MARRRVGLTAPPVSGAAQHPAELEADTAAVGRAPAPTRRRSRCSCSPRTSTTRTPGATTLGFVTRLYDDVLRHDPTPIEVSTALPMSSPGVTPGATQLVEDVVLSPEARAIRVDQAFHALLKSYPNGADLALWVNRLTGPGFKGLSGQLDGRGDRRLGHVLRARRRHRLGIHDQSLPGPAQPIADARRPDRKRRAPCSHPGGQGTGRCADRHRRGDKGQARPSPRHVVTGAEFRTDEVTSFFANYMHPTCKQLLAQECTSSIGTPTASQLAAALASMQSGTTEEEIIAGVLGSPQFYAEPRQHADRARSMASTRI